jgi:hypothetical protein
MCDQHHSPQLTRRAMLAFTASAAGALTVGFLSCREQSKKSPSASAPSTAIAPAPDLGAEVFPDSAGKAIAKPGDAPVIVLPRTDWTKTHPNLNNIAVMNGVARITVHHTAGQLTTDAWKPTAGELENIREFHSGSNTTDRNWADIAYHFVVDRAGRVWQARPLAYQGAHVHLHNEHNLGIVLLGNFDTQSPAAAQLVSLAAFIPFLRQLYAVPLNEIFTHGELSENHTACPGKRLQSIMDRIRKKWAAA